MIKVNDFFAYGTLMCEDIMQEVTGYDLSHAPGILKGFKRTCIKGESYPAIVPDNAGCVEGVAYRNVPYSVWSRLDRFEGELYDRRLVQVELKNDGKVITAATYVIKPAFIGCLDGTDWDFVRFLLHSKTAFQRNFKGYRSL